MKESVKKELVGTVVSACNNKTITVKVETYKKDSLYGKRVRYSKKYELNKAKVGDTVRIVECKPVSKTKTFYLAEVIKEAVIL